MRLVHERDAPAGGPGHPSPDVEDGGDDVVHGQGPGERHGQRRGLFGPFRRDPGPLVGRGPVSLGGAYLGEIADHPEPLAGPAVRPAGRRHGNDAGLDHPHGGAVASATGDPELGLEGLTVLDRPAPGAPDPLPVVGMDHAEPAEPGQLRRMPPGEGPQTGQIGIECPVAFGMEHVHRGGVHETEVACLGPRPLPLDRPRPAGVDRDERHAHQPDLRVVHRIPAGEPRLRRSGTIGGDHDLQVHHRLAGAQHPCQQSVEFLAGVAEELGDGTAEVLVDRPAVEPGECVVHPQEPPGRVEQGETGRGPREQRV